ncbi:MAG: DEAD/DEAH box helicase [Proteobacteria bacterium]|jgi:DNA repair protein RadD|nr:DEAD/DEAH box helicase [Pseudomonadota bacterium]
MYQLRPYQKEAVESTLQFFRRRREPAVIVLPTGAGKSLVIAELAKIAKGRVLVLAHVKELVEQNHQKYTSYGLEAGIFSASLGKKESQQKAIFGSVQSVARADDSFFENFSLLVIDECHRVAEEGSTQYQEIIQKLTEKNPQLAILGLTATPYRLGMGWIFEVGFNGEIKTDQKRFFKQCVYELPLSYMIQNRFLTTPVKVDIPVTCYDFSQLFEKGESYTTAQVEEVLKNQKRLTPLIVNNIVDIAEKYHRKGVMIFSSTVKHAEEIMECLPKDQSRVVLGDTDIHERDQIVEEFKQRKFKYLVNVSVLTTGFDAPHVDVIAIMRPTESNALYQQIIGRGLRLSEGKKDCYILDYTGMSHDIFAPTVKDKKPAKDTVPVRIPCPECEFENDFWGYVDDEGMVIEHYGRRCQGGIRDSKTWEVRPCGYLFRFKICHICSEKNDVTARECVGCKAVLIDADAKLKQARLSKKAHVMEPDRIEFNEKTDKNGNHYLEVRYYDWNGHYLSEAFFFNNPTAIKKFNINFLRSHLRRPELAMDMNSPKEFLKYQVLMRKPSYVIARKQEQFWRITEKIFSEEL